MVSERTVHTAGMGREGVGQTTAKWFPTQTRAVVYLRQSDAEEGQDEGRFLALDSMYFNFDAICTYISRRFMCKACTVLHLCHRSSLWHANNDWLADDVGSGTTLVLEASGDGRRPAGEPGLSHLAATFQG